ncbi:MAG TPA: hypothetical protein VK826_02955 [Bacteroidia bacterium]|nr:hypothetical protein [Bacteroidia bacterium]
MTRLLRNFFLILSVVFATQVVVAQVPYETKIDSASLLRHKREKVLVSYWLEQKYDSVAGTIPDNAPVDTVGYHRYDREGRHVESWTYDDEHIQRYWRWYYDSLGRVIKRVRTNADSTDGHVYRWYYNDAGQVVREDIFRIKEKTTEQLFYRTFAYDSAGRLTIEKTFFIEEQGGGAWHEQSDYYYNDSGLEILNIVTHRNRDTLTVDSTFYFGNRNNYTKRGYFVRKDESGQNVSTPFSLNKATRDTMNGLETSTYYFCMYDLGTGEPEKIYADTVVCYSDRRTVEERGSLILKYTYTKKDKLLHWIVYNRRNQPLKKCTISIIRYK